MLKHFGVTDLMVFICTLLISFSVGIFFAIWDKAKNRESPNEYFLAGRKSRTFPVTLSFMVTFQSSLLILATPVEVYAYSMVYCYHVVGLTVSYILAGLVIVPVFYPLKITSVNKYFYLRYGDNLLRYFVLFTGVTFNICYMGTVTYGTCVAAEIVMGVPYWGTVLIYTFVTTIYTSIGGIKAVIWTDVFQLLIMTLGIVAVLVKSTLDAGGISSVTQLAHHQLYMGEFSFDPTVRYTFWNISFGALSVFMYLCLTQSGIQRINSTPSIQSARRIYILAGPIYSLFFFMTAYEGVTIFAYHASKGCDIYNGGLIDNINEILPVTVMQLFTNIPGMSGLFIASLSSAALSTLSSCLSSLSAVTYEDVIRVIYPEIEDYRATQLSKIVVLLYGLAGMSMTFLIAKLPGSVVNIFQGFMGCIDGPTTAVFLLSIFYRRATSKGVFIGALCGMCVSFWLIMGHTFSSIPGDPKLPSGPTDNCSMYENSSYTYRNWDQGNDRILQQNLTLNSTAHDQTEQLSFLEKIYTISYVLYSLIGFLVATVLGITTSLVIGSPGNAHVRYMFSFDKHILKDLLGKGRTSEVELSTALALEPFLAAGETRCHSPQV